MSLNINLSCRRFILEIFLNGVSCQKLINFFGSYIIKSFLFLPKFYLHIKNHTVLQRAPLYPPSLRQSLFNTELILLVFTSVSLNDMLALLVFQIQALSFDLVTVQLYSHPNYKCSFIVSPSPSLIIVTIHSQAMW